MTNKRTNADKRESDSPILYLGISQAYLEAYNFVWSAKFGCFDRGQWDLAILLHPVSHLLGVALETAMKGLASSRVRRVPRTHDLKDLLSKISDADLLASLDSALVGLPVPEDLFESNPDTPRPEIEGVYRRHHLHFDTLNRV